LVRVTAVPPRLLLGEQVLVTGEQEFLEHSRQAKNLLQSFEDQGRAEATGLAGNRYTVPVGIDNLHAGLVVDLPDPD
jgi:hypothetical protein